MLFRFAEFELDQLRAELRGPDGTPVKLRRKTFDMLTLFAANAGRILSKQELIEAIWPNLHVGEDSLFQCIREIRHALGDEKRQILKVVSGRGYLLDVTVTTPVADTGVTTTAPAAAPPASEPVDPGLLPDTPVPPVSDIPPDADVPRQPAQTTRWWFGLNRLAAVAAAATLSAVVGFAAAPVFAPGVPFKQLPPTVAVMPIAAGGNDAEAAAMAAAVTTQVTDGLAKIATIRVVAPQSSSSAAADYVVKGELQKAGDGWGLQARVVVAGTDEVQPVAAVSTGIKDVELQIQQSRLAAGIGYQLAQLLNTAVYGAQPGAAPLPSSSKAAIEQATAALNRTTPRRFDEAQTMLEKALKDDPGNIDVEVALAALKVRGLQLVWYGRKDSIAAEASAKAMLEHALGARPNSLPVLEAHCRFLVATNQFVEGLVACARTLSLNPWDGMALYHIGMAQLQLGRFDDALETFKQADRYDTPEVSRWTWLLGAGLACVLMDRDEEAVPWLQRSIAITPASGRTDMVLSAAYQRTGRTDDARAAMARALELRPSSTAENVTLPFKNTSQIYRVAADRLVKANVEAGLPRR